MAPKNEKSKAIAPKIPNSALAMYEGEETGFEETSAADYAIPFLNLLQKGSPQCDKDESAYIKGAEAGMFLDTGTGELLESVRIVPCHYTRKFVEWKPREEGGGLVAQYEPGEEPQLPMNEKGQPQRENGNILVDTRYFFCIRLNGENEPSPVVVSMSSTQTKKAKTWMSRMQAIKATGENGMRFTPPMHSHVWVLSSVTESNDKGSWKGFKIELEGPITAKDLFQKAKDNREMFKAAATRTTVPLLGTGQDKE